MKVKNDVWPDRVSAQELSLRQSLAILLVSCLHELYPHNYRSQIASVFRRFSSNNGFTIFGKVQTILPT